MRVTKIEQEIEQDHLRSLLLIVATLVIANLILIVGFTATSNAQTLDSAASVMQLAKMLAAPDMTPDISFGSTQFNIFGAMAAGFLIMVIGFIAMTRNLMHDMSEPQRSRF